MVRLDFPWFGVARSKLSSDLDTYAARAGAAAHLQNIFREVRRTGGVRRSSPALLALKCLRPDDLDATVLRLAHTIGGRHALVVLAAAAHIHGLPGHTQAAHSVSDVVGTPLREPLIVANRAGRIGV